MSHPATHGEQLLTIPEVASRLRVHRATVYRRIKDGALQVSANLGTGKGSNPRISETDLQAFIDQHATRSDA